MFFHFLYVSIVQLHTYLTLNLMMSKDEGRSQTVAC